MSAVTAQSDSAAWTRISTSRVHHEDLDVYARDQTEAAPVIALLHGLEDSWESWKPLAATLSDDARCYMVNLPWRAGGKYRWRTRPPQEWIAYAVDAVPEPIDLLIAHSFSANAVIQRLADGEPLSADALVLVSPFYRPPHVPLSWHTFDRSFADFRATMTDGLRIRLGDRFARLESDVFEKMADTMIERIGVPGFLAVFDQFAAASSLELGHCETPSLIIAGSHDPGIAGERAEWLGRAMPHARLAVDPAYSHFCHIEQPELIAPLIADLLRAPRKRHGNDQKGS